MLKVFLDANVWYSAARSPEGGSGLIVKLGINQKIQIITSSVALKEVDRNIRLKEKESSLVRHYQNLQQAASKIVYFNNDKLCRELEGVINPKDALILGAAIQSKVDCFVTLDKKHFDHLAVKARALPIKILSPSEFLDSL